GYFMGYFTGAGPEEASNMLNIIYNLADVVNKIAFGVIIWNVAVTESDKNNA
ncbi:MAG: biphenyl 2,3-dioxygenase, partial [Tateyamaria sp.]|nr:biphenyl 2,3-dioxygenase [Tateyamaria sp.]